jgi:hypothetical protein
LDLKPKSGIQLGGTLTESEACGRSLLAGDFGKLPTVGTLNRLQAGSCLNEACCDWYSANMPV